MPDPPATASGPPRRTVLRFAFGGVAGAAVAASAGCDLRVGSPEPDRTSTAPPDPSTDERALGAALQRAEALTTTYGQAAVVRPDLADRLRQLVADHSAHVRALSPLAGPTAAATPTSTQTATASETGTSPPQSPDPPLTAVTALSVLAQAERAASAAALADLPSVSGPAARLLASIAGCTTAHVAVLATLPATAKRAS